MEENKNLTPEETVIETEIPETIEKKSKLNMRLIKKGSYSVAVTAIVLVLIIALNFLINAIGEKVSLEFDMTKDKISTLSENNKKYLENLDEQVFITVCAEEKGYRDGMMDSYAEASNIYGGTDYYKQTITLIEKYADASDKINVEFVDTQDSAFAAVTAKYPDESIVYGDIIVSAGERYQKLGFSDIYEVEYNEEYANYGYTMYNVTGNNLETELTGAIRYAITGKRVSFALLTGHSKKDYTEDYAVMLEKNNYTVENIDSAFVNSISKDYDVAVIVAPTVDFTPEEITALSKFLENGGEYGKGLIYFADATVPVLPNLTEFLAQWGIGISEGILFETNENNHMPEMPTAMGLFPDEDDEITENMNIFCTGCNVPMKVIETEDEGVSAISLIATTETVVNAPLGTSDSWTGASDYETDSFSGLIQSVKTKDEKSSYVFAFSSAEFIASQWAQYPSFSNMNIALAVSERAGAVDDSASFVTKTITNESFAGDVTEASAGVVRMIFVFLIPVITLVLGIYIYIKRRNA